MRLAQFLMFMSVLNPHHAVYVRGHSQAAEKVRKNIATFTCFSSGAEPETSTAILHVDHIQNVSGRSWVIMILTDLQHNVLYKKKAEENPWPLPSTVDGLLKNLARSTCQGREYSPVQKSSAQHATPPSHQGGPGDALIRSPAN